MYAPSAPFQQLHRALPFLRCVLPWPLRSRRQHKGDVQDSKAAKAPPASKPDPDLCWDNLDDIKHNYDLAHEEAIAALSEVLGED